MLGGVNINIPIRDSGLLDVGAFRCRTDRRTPPALQRQLGLLGRGAVVLLAGTGPVAHLERRRQAALAVHEKLRPRRRVGDLPEHDLRSRSLVPSTSEHAVASPGSAPFLGPGLLGLLLLPRADSTAGPEHPFEELEFHAEDGVRLHGLYFLAKGASRGTVVQFHGTPATSRATMTRWCG